eukprot:9953552-Prorocentrum_lima.AAC.1
MDVRSRPNDAPNVGAMLSKWLCCSGQVTPDSESLKLLTRGAGAAWSVFATASRTPAIASFL